MPFAGGLQGLVLGLSICLSSAVVAAPPVPLPDIPEQLIDLADFEEEIPEFPAIPPAVQRPLGEEDGERIFVNQFEVLGITDRPEHGITFKAIADMLEDIRIERQNLKGLDKHGFTKEERDDIGKFLNSVVDSPDLDMGFDAYQQLVDKLRAQKAERLTGLTIGQLQKVADEVTKLYRQQGFILAQAFVPAQDVIDGKVRIEVLEGRLGEVIVEGNQRFSPDMLARPFDELIDAPVMADTMEQALSLLADYPGVNAFGVLQPGTRVGSTDLVLKVQKEELFNGVASIDNRGSRLTGKYRAKLDLTFNSPFLSADKLDISASRSFNEKNAINATFDYFIPLFSPQTGIGAIGGRNMFHVGQELADQEITGRSTNWGAYVSHVFERNRQNNIRGKIGFTRKHAQTLLDNSVASEDELAVLSLEGSFDHVSLATQSIYAGSLQYVHGFNGTLGAMAPGHAQGESGHFSSSRRAATGPNGTPENVGAGFDKLVFALASAQRVTGNSTLLMRLNAQYTKDPLLSVEQFSVSGPTTERYTATIGLDSA